MVAPALKQGGSNESTVVNTIGQPRGSRVVEGWFNRPGSTLCLLFAVYKEQLPPPTPPNIGGADVVNPSPEQRRERVANGSRRKRDLAAMAADGQFSEWLAHYQSVTGKTEVRGSKPARAAFAARLADSYSMADLKMATVGCHGDSWCRENYHDVPTTILRASKIDRYIELGRAMATADPLPDPEQIRAGMPELEAAWPEARARLRNAVPIGTFELWLASLCPAGKVGGKVYISAPADRCQWVQRRYSTLIADALAPELGKVEVTMIPAGKDAPDA